MTTGTIFRSIKYLLFIAAITCFSIAFLKNKKTYRVDSKSYINYITLINTELRRYENMGFTTEAKKQGGWSDTSLQLVNTIIDATNKVIKRQLHDNTISIEDTLKAPILSINNKLEYFLLPQDSSESMVRRIFVTDDLAALIPKVSGRIGKTYEEGDNIIYSNLASMDDDFNFKYPYYVFVKETYDPALFSNLAMVFFIAFAVMAAFGIYQKTIDRQVKEKKDRLAAEKQQEAERPKDIKPSWDIAQSTLQEYYQRNLKQINGIFIASILVMTAGFVIIVLGILKTYKGETNVQLITICSGVITEFIGATFIFIYNSTVKQALGYTQSLEKVNSVGMSVKILDSIQDDDDATKDRLEEAKIEIAKILIQRSKDTPPE